MRGSDKDAPPKVVPITASGLQGLASIVTPLGIAAEVRSEVSRGGDPTAYTKYEIYTHPTAGATPRSKDVCLYTNGRSLCGGCRVRGHRGTILIPGGG
eukprot:9287422-Prorocentrum_lima.AAC.1